MVGAVDRVGVVRDAEALASLSHPIRIRMLEALREPSSAAAVARVIGEPRQKVNYHLKELEKAGLVEPVGERRSGNFVESLYRAVARAFVVAPEATWGDPRRLDTLRAQLSLENLVTVGAQLQHDAVALLDRAAFEGEEIASAAITLETAFLDESDRTAFLRQYVETVKELVGRYSARAGARYRIVLAAHPSAETAD